MLVHRDSGADVGDPVEIDVGEGQAWLPVHLDDQVAPGVRDQRMTISFAPILMLPSLGGRVVSVMGVGPRKASTNGAA